MSNVVSIEGYRKGTFSSQENDNADIRAAAKRRDKVSRDSATNFATDDDGIPAVYLQRLHEIEASWFKLQRLYADLELEHRALREMVETLW